MGNAIKCFPKKRKGAKRLEDDEESDTESVPETLLSTKYDVDYDNVLGQGTFAVVCKATNRSTKKEVAVKLINKATSRRDLLNTEIYILQNFGNHVNIVNLFDLYETETEVQLVTELMTG